MTNTPSSVRRHRASPLLPDGDEERTRRLAILHESIETGVRPFRAAKDDPLLFEKTWSEVSVDLGLDVEDTGAVLLVRRAFWGRSLHASILLVERLLPDWAWSVERDNDVDDSRPYWCELRPPESRVSRLANDAVSVSGTSPALAVLAALMTERLR